MKNPITSAVLRAAAKLEAWARSPHPIEPVLPQYRVRQILTGSPVTFDHLTYVNSHAITASFVDADGELVFKIILP